MTPLFTVPTSTATGALGYITSQLSDPGTLTLVEIVIAIPLFFWAVRAIISLFPKHRGRTH